MNPALTKVRTAAVEAERAREKLYKAMRDARAAGASLRQIAETVGLSPETVRTITQKR